MAGEDEVETTQKKDMLAMAMLKGTMDLHDKAEKCSYILRMIESRITRPQYRLLLADLHVIYSALEVETEQLKEDPIYGPMYCPDELNRVDALEKDLLYFYGGNWRKSITPTKAALKYADHIHEIGQRQPCLLLAHSFVRYLGDLSGGQVLKFKMSRCMSMPASGEGLYFYQFDKVQNAIRLKNYLMGRINNLEVEPQLFDDLLQEARLAFQLNIDVFEELEPMAERINRLRNPPQNIVLFEKIWQASTVVLSFAVMYNLSNTLSAIV